MPFGWESDTKYNNGRVCKAWLGGGGVNVSLEWEIPGETECVYGLCVDNSWHNYLKAEPLIQHWHFDFKVSRNPSCLKNHVKTIPHLITSSFVLIKSRVHCHLHLIPDTLLSLPQLRLEIPNLCVVCLQLLLARKDLTLHTQWGGPCCPAGHWLHKLSLQAGN